MGAPLRPDEAIDQFESNPEKRGSRSKTALVFGLIAFGVEFAMMGLAVWAALKRPPLLEDENFIAGIGLAILLAAGLALIGFFMALADAMNPEKRSNTSGAALALNALYLLSVVGLYIIGLNS